MLVFSSARARTRLGSSVWWAYGAAKHGGVGLTKVAAEPIGRLGQPAEIAASAVWPNSDTASFVTGVALRVDGGWVAR
jgi:enoyl-ACP reductase-like protein